MQRLSKLVLALAAACFLLQVPLPANAKEAVKMKPGNMKPIKMKSGDLKSASDVIKTASPDLIVSRINYSPGSPVAGDEITLWVFFKNNGQGRADASGARVRVGGETNPPLVQVPALNPGQEWRYTRKVTLNHGSNYVVATKADSENQVVESNERNNVKKTNILVKSNQADLVVKKANFSPGAPDTNSDITLWVFVKNIGGSRAGNSYVSCKATIPYRVFADFSIPTPALNPGQERRISKKFTIYEAGNHMMKIKADARSTITEANENNNLMSIHIPVRQGPKPDLVISRINYSPGNLKQHQQATVWYFVKNTGQGKSKSCYLRTTSSLNNYSIWHRERVPELPPGQEWRYEGLFISNAAGKYKLKAVIDKPYIYVQGQGTIGDVEESNENNNELLKDINVAKVNN